MIEREFNITWKHGLAECSSPLLAKTSSRFECNIRVKMDDIEGDGKNFMGLMMLAADTGSRIKVIAEGKDEQEAMDAISRLFSETFSRDGWAC